MSILKEKYCLALLPLGSRSFNLIDKPLQFCRGFFVLEGDLLNERVLKEKRHEAYRNYSIDHSILRM